MRSSRQIAVIAILALVTMTVGICCGPVLASAAGKPADHCNPERSHEVPIACCASHTSDVAPDLVSPAPPAEGVLELGSAVQARAADETVASTAINLLWPPGSRDLTTRLCSFLI